MSPWEKLLVLTGATYLVFKGLTLRGLGPGRAALYVALWPGMDPRPFARTVPGEGRGLVAGGACRMALGAALLAGVRTGTAAGDAVVLGLGVGFLVHLGLCDVLAGFWRGRGVPVERLFDDPAASRSLSEFWGRRWNRAFHAVARDRVFKPAARRWGTAAGVAATFAFSGLLHDLLLSVPAGAGYGLPTGYFLLQGGLVLAERRWEIRGRLWTAFGVLAPLPLLFHPAFVREILLPLR